MSSHFAVLASLAPAVSVVSIWAKTAAAARDRRELIPELRGYAY